MKSILTEIHLSEQHDGRWFGRIPYSDDGNGNELDCLQPTPEEALKCLQDQLKEHSNETHSQTMAQENPPRHL